MKNPLALTALSFFGLFSGCSVEVPPPVQNLENHWANQGWTADESHWFHHADQGTNTFGVPYEWFKALEQPELSLSEVGLLSDQAYLARLGFIPSPAKLDASTHAAAGYDYKALGQASAYAGGNYNDANLPVGFAVGGELLEGSDPNAERRWAIPGTGRNAHSLGLTCAACHTGQIEYGSHRILIDGGAGMISLDKVREALKMSLVYTKLVPGRFDRFAARVLGEANSSANRDLLKQQFDALLEVGKQEGALEEQAIKDGVTEGFTRLDALNRIGNEVFGRQMARQGNFFAVGGPVSFPFIWNTPWFDWVQYNSSIQQPMIRNAGEALGVKAPVNLIKPGPTLYGSELPIGTIHEMEKLLAGEHAPLEQRRFSGLQSPQWSSLPLPPLNKALVDRGRELYLRGNAGSGGKPLCAGCHLPPPDSPEFFDAQHWESPGPGFDQQYLKLKTVPVIKIGTDCKTAYEMVYRSVRVSNDLGLTEVVAPVFQPDQVPADCPQPNGKVRPGPGETALNFGAALGQVVSKTVESAYQKNGITGPQVAEYDGQRPPGIRLVVDGLPSYKARPLNGVWATAPFLHNGSVPNLYLLLSTQGERDAEAAEFYLGNRSFDPKYVGFYYRTDAGPKLPDAGRLTDTTGLFRLDTRLPGNRNVGHLFTDENLPGRIGPKLSSEDRLALIEFLKSL